VAEHRVGVSQVMACVRRQIRFRLANAEEVQGYGADTDNGDPDVRPPDPSRSHASGEPVSHAAFLDVVRALPNADLLASLGYPTGG